MTASLLSSPEHATRSAPRRAVAARYRMGPLTAVEQIRQDSINSFLDASLSDAERAIRRARATHLMGERGTWDGQAQQHLGVIPTPVLRSALEYFAAKHRTIIDDLTQSILRHRLNAQLHAITLVLDERAAETSSASAPVEMTRPRVSRNRCGQTTVTLDDHLGVEVVLIEGDRATWTIDGGAGEMYSFDERATLFRRALAAIDTYDPTDAELRSAGMLA